MTESCFGNDIMETSCHILRSDQLAEAVTADKAFKLFVIRYAADFLEVGFKLLPLQQHSFDMRNQRERSPCGIGFQSVLHIELSSTAAVIVAYDLTLNGDRLIGEVDRIPPQTKHLTSSQPIIGCDMHDQFQLIVLENLKQFTQLVLVIECGFITLGSFKNSSKFTFISLKH